MSTPAQRHLTSLEYLEWERCQESKHEYFNGDIFAMTGASRKHNLITANLLAGLYTRLRHKPCEIYSSDMRVKVSLTGLYTYPDIVVVCGEPQFEDAILDTLLNPILIVEVLSHSTENYDRGKKFGHYRRLPSLQEYLLVAQDQCQVEHYVRQPDEAWLLREYKHPEDLLQFIALNCELSLAEIYERVI
ncbi:MAG: Uma2 family endonuclease [Thioploca sp.]|nr:Uma2 family endonuclease [Thioploca sp.]